MRVRAFEEKDRSRVEELYSLYKFHCDWEPLDSGQMEVVSVIVDDFDRVQMLCAAQKIVSVYLIAPEGRAEDKFEGLILLHHSMKADLRKRGIRNAVAWLQPQVMKAFGKRLVADFLWRKQEGPSFFVRTTDV